MSFKDKLKQVFNKFVDTEIEDEDVSKFISKSEELREVIGIVLVPEETDLQGDIYSEEEIHKAIASFNLLCNKTKLQHSIDASARVISSWQTLSDEVINGKPVKKGTWLIRMKLPEDEWNMVKKGLFTGFSIGCRAKGSVIENEESV